MNTQQMLSELNQDILSDVLQKMLMNELSEFTDYTTERKTTVLDFFKIIYATLEKK